MYGGIEWNKDLKILCFVLFWGIFFFSIDIQWFQPSFVEKLSNITNIISYKYWIVLVFLSKWLIINVGICFWTYISVPLRCMSIHMSITHCFEYCWFKVWNWVLSQYQKLQSKCFSILGASLDPSHFHINLKSTFDKNCLEFINQFEKNCHLDSVSLSTYEHRVSLHLFTLFTPSVISLNAIL